jgi:hypothetical protein
MNIQIKHRISSCVIFEYDAENNSVKLTLEMAVKNKANLWGANLRGANLWEANLRGANLRGADFGEADFGGAVLENIKTPSVNDHFLISELLWRKAETQQQNDFAARIRFELSQCWKYFLMLAKEKDVFEWAKNVLCQWKEFEEKINSF